jgi:hypothetical protein
MQVCLNWKVTFLSYLNFLKPVENLCVENESGRLRPEIFNLWYSKTSYTNQNETQELLESWAISDPHTHKDSSPNWGDRIP